MKSRITNVIAGVFVLAAAACGGGEKAGPVQQSFCNDTACINEPLKFESAADGKPFVKISFADCKIDTIHWEKGGMGVIKDIVFSDFIDKEVKPSKSLISCDIVDAKYAWIKFNDCQTGRGYLIRLPFDKDGKTSKFKSAINNFDPEFKVADGLVSYYDNTFIYVHDINTDKVAQTLLTDTGVKNIDYDNVHSLIKSVDITKENITAKLTVDGKTIDINKPLSFK